MRIATLTLLIILVLDQALKWFVVVGLNLREVLFIQVLPPWFNLTMAWNRGVNFGLFANDSDVMRWVLIALAVVISTWVWLWVRRERGGAGLQLSAGFLVGGALGNVIDRLIWGAVADFLNFTCCGWHNPYAFNVADIAIFIGAFGLILFAGGKKDP
ncbi:MAG: lipoprotein signal peptidase LspA [Rhodobacteraceae bacterium HLUCCA12]|nr:MAG: lipoprotein signal peptidase LspA [Rhodobacteraceae bacterium HLUCCA12]